MTYFHLQNIITEEEQYELLRRLKTKLNSKPKHLDDYAPMEDTGVEIDLTGTSIVNDFKTIIYNKVKQLYGENYHSNNWWVSISQPLTRVVSHKHKDDGLSVVFYLQAENDCGAFELQDYEQILQPKTGDLLIFPGSCYHRVTENKSTKPRICLVFDLEKTNK